MFGWGVILWGRLFELFWNCAWVEPVGVATSWSPPAAPLLRFGTNPPWAFGRSRVLPIPGLIGDGGGGCAAFKRAAVKWPGVVLPRLPCISLCDAPGATLG